MSKENTARNVRLRAERHAKRMTAQRNKRVGYDMENGSAFAIDLKVPRGTARALRRAPLRVAYAKRQAIAAAKAARGSWPLCSQRGC